MSEPLSIYVKYAGEEVKINVASGTDGSDFKKAVAAELKERGYKIEGPFALVVGEEVAKDAGADAERQPFFKEGEGALRGKFILNARAALDSGVAAFLKARKQDINVEPLSSSAAAAAGVIPMDVVEPVTNVSQSLYPKLTLPLSAADLSKITPTSIQSPAECGEFLAAVERVLFAPPLQNIPVPPALARTRRIPDCFDRAPYTTCSLSACFFNFSDRRRKTMGTESIAQAALQELVKIPLETLDEVLNIPLSVRTTSRSRATKASKDILPDLFVDAAHVESLTAEGKSDDLALCFQDLYNKVTFVESHGSMRWRIGFVISNTEAQFAVLAEKELFGGADPFTTNKEFRPSPRAPVQLHSRKENSGIRIFLVGSQFSLTDYDDQCSIVLATINLVRMWNALLPRYICEKTIRAAIASHGDDKSNVTFAYDTGRKVATIVKKVQLQDVARAREVKKIYNAVANHECPNLACFAMSEALWGITLTVTPVGLCNLPRTELAARGAIRDMLCAVSFLHSRNVYHSDIRWPNIAECFRPEHRWVLFDLEDSRLGAGHSIADMRAAEGLQNRVSGAAADVFMVGRLLYNDAVFAAIRESPLALDFAQRTTAPGSVLTTDAASALAHPWLAQE